MRKSVFVTIITVVMTLIITVISLFDFAYMQYVLSAVSIVLFTVASIMLKKFTPKNTVKEFFSLKPPRFREVGTALGFLFILVFGSFMLNIFADYMFGIFGVDISNAPKLTDGNYAMTVITVALLPAIYEETFFRGAVQSFLSKEGDIISVVVTSALFTVMHGLDPYFLTTFFAGVVLSILVKLTGSLYTAMIVHFINNIMSYVLAYYADLLSNVQMNSLLLYFSGLILIGSSYFVVCIVIRKYKKQLKRSKHRFSEGEEIWQEKTED